MYRFSKFSSTNDLKSVSCQCMQPKRVDACLSLPPFPTAASHLGYVSGRYIIFVPQFSLQKLQTQSKSTVKTNCNVLPPSLSWIQVSSQTDSLQRQQVFSVIRLPISSDPLRCFVPRETNPAASLSQHHNKDDVFGIICFVSFQPHGSPYRCSMKARYVVRTTNGFHVSSFPVTMGRFESFQLFQSREWIGDLFKAGVTYLFF